MQIALVRVGIDSGAGGMQGPLFPDGSFEYVPSPDKTGVDNRTYGNTAGRYGRKLVEYFSPRRQAQMESTFIHFDPEFSTFTYGDSTRLKSGLRWLMKGDFLVFFAGLEGYNVPSVPALYLIGYFVVETAGYSTLLSDSQLQRLFGANFHVRNRPILRQQCKNLVLVKGGTGSRLFGKAVQFARRQRQTTGGRPRKVITAIMQNKFGDFGGRLCFQRSVIRWVDPAFVPSGVTFLLSCI